MLDMKVLDDASPGVEAQFFAAFEEMLACDDGNEASRHLRDGRAIYVSDQRFPRRAVRLHPDGKRELMRLDKVSGQLVVERVVY